MDIVMSETASGGLRRVLNRIRQVMAKPATAQVRLNELVKVIAAEMVAEVCSVYVVRAGETLELFATQGLNPSAVHQTRLRVGEGLVGTVAATVAPLNLHDAQAHPKFVYRPETGEEIFHSFVGVPIIRGGRVRGVLVAQHRTHRHYDEEEVEALEMIATVLAELIAGGDLVDPGEQTPAQGNAILPVRLTGIKVNGGLATGEAVLHQPRITIRRLLAEDPEAEHRRLAEAVSEMHQQLDRIFAREEVAVGGDHRDVLDAYRMYAEDQGWLRRIGEAIDSGMTAEAAVQKEEDDMRARLGAVHDPYLRERLHDFEDLASRLLRHLAGEAFTAARADLPQDVILLAHMLGPAELLDYDPRRLRALVLEEGSPNAHVAIVARALNIPVVGQVEDLLARIDPRDPIVVDGDNAIVYVRAGEDIQQMAAETIAMRLQRRAHYAAMKDLPPVTRDGVRVSLKINAGLMMDLAALREYGADGVGLYRTEIPFMVRSEFPNVEVQTASYRNVIEAADGKPVRFRTLDVGGDKELPYFRNTGDANPALGWRAIRLSLDRPALLRRQVRALVRASRGGDLELMFPLVAETAEFNAARALVDLEVAREAKRGEAPVTVRVGVMMEVPGLAFQLRSLLPLVSFISIGSNDLFQFMYAADRANPRTAERYDTLSPGFLTFLKSLVEDCGRANVPLAVCGEMAGRPLEAMALIGLGLRELSMPPPSIGPVKTMVRSLAVDELAPYLAGLLDSPDHSLRETLKNYARDHAVTIEEP